VNRNDVIDVLSAVAAATRRTIGETDVAVWMAVIGAHSKTDALQAVRDHLAEKPGVWLEPGHVHQRVRASVRDRLEREPDAARDARMEALAAKAAEDREELAQRKGLPAPDARVFTRPDHNTLLMKCPWCKAEVGFPCVVPHTNDKPANGVHPSRLELTQGLPV